ncbi:glycosyltransferase family 57 protein [Collybiopsis luxurians FD-317 M1]|uniref:Alpha-1,3-glucosyltransferase n=1 Tax=Collybiopsis luxurians FD-317 M1 TaxID=944289 RepID=A0A0D0CB34_9AGAR|nr:glycosyltransferase family 57 protein [Collybiopsis luxurians FD-317 M1]
MGRRFIRWSHKRGMRVSLMGLIFFTCVTLKLCLGLGSYSGENTPPMYGDYEAQRHWMEITLHLPTSQWYTYDLQYWGLDYPPLTAYVSLACGVVANFINPVWVALDSSRGIETPTSKFFMRGSVVAFDSLIYVPALVLFSRIWYRKRSRRTQDLAFLLLMLQPALFLIDSGHFQYNSVMLGLTIMALNCFATGHDLPGAVFFVLSLGFKQMALYYAPAIGSYLAAKCVLLGPKEGGRLFVRLGSITVAAFIILFLPWLPPFSSSPSAILDPVSRIFPFARGLFEDKVANFWCASNVVIKWNRWVAQGILVKGAAALTLLGFLPSVAVIGKSAWDLKTWSLGPVDAAKTDNSQNSPDKESPATVDTPILPLLPYALLNSSMSFFLFSFQVHEKTILLPLMPLMLLFSGSTPDSEIFAWGALGSNVAVFSMWPLLKKDGLCLQYFASILLWNRVIGHNPFKLVCKVLPYKSLVHLISAGVYAAIFVLHLLEPIITPPARYPDLFPVLNVLVSTPVFVSIWLWSIKSCIQVSWAITGPSGLGVEASEHHRDRASSVFSDAGERVSLLRQSKGDRTRAVSLGHVSGKRVRRSSTHSVSGSSSAIPSSTSTFRGNSHSATNSSS